MAAFFLSLVLMLCMVLPKSQTDDDELIELKESAKHFPGKRPDICKLRRWTDRGCNGVCLEAWCIGRTIYTSRAAIKKFIRDSTAVSLKKSKSGAPNNAAAKALLDAAGVQPMRTPPSLSVEKTGLRPELKAARETAAAKGTATEFPPKNSAAARSKTKPQKASDRELTP